MHLLKVQDPFNTVIKHYPSRRAEDVSDSYKFNLSSTDLPLLARSMERDVNFPNYYKVELREPMKGLFEWYAFADHVEKQESPNNWIVVTDPTVIKRQPVAGTDSLDDKSFFNLPIKSQPLLANWVRLEGKYYEFELTAPYNGARNWFAFAEHVEIGGKPLLVPVS